MKTKQPPKLLPGYKDNFETLKLACQNGDLALLSAIRKSDGKPVALVCAVWIVPKTAERQMIPLAVMCEGNPYDDFEPPV